MNIVSHPTRLKRYLRHLGQRTEWIAGQQAAVDVLLFGRVLYFLGRDRSLSSKPFDEAYWMKAPKRAPDREAAEES